jgi:hypothetical protein
MNDFPWQNLLVRVGMPLAIVVLYRVLVPILRARKDGTANAWPQTSGYAEHTCVTTIHVAGGGDQWVGEVAYSYRAEGEYYTGLLQFPTTTEKQAERSIEGWKGLQLIVRYHPNKPSESHIILDEQPPRIPAA